MGTAKSLICRRGISIKSTQSWSTVFTHNLWKPVEVLEAILISPQQTFCHIPWQLETSVPIAMKALKMIPCWKSISRITTRAFSREALEFVLRDPKYVDWLNKTTSVTEGRNTITVTQMQESNKLLAEKLNSENKYTACFFCIFFGAFVLSSASSRFPVWSGLVERVCFLVFFLTFFCGFVLSSAGALASILHSRFSVT